YDAHQQVIIINTHLLCPHDSTLSMTVFDRFIRFSSRTMKTFPSLMLLFCLYRCLHETDLDAATKGNRYIHSCLSLDVYISNAFTFVILNKFFCGTISRLNEEIKGFVKSGFLIICQRSNQIQTRPAIVWFLAHAWRQRTGEQRK
ncbi:hypothetical protein HID58_050580, partial [Brassica napus]